MSLKVESVAFMVAIRYYELETALFLGLTNPFKISSVSDLLFLPWVLICLKSKEPVPSPSVIVMEAVWSSIGIAGLKFRGGSLKFFAKLKDPLGLVLKAGLLPPAVRCGFP